MKKIIFTSLLACVAGNAMSQTQVLDSVLTNQGYKTQVWYDLTTGTKTNVEKADWDIAFSVENMNVSILSNHGTSVWKYETADTSAWNSADTAGISTWTKLYNSDTTWEAGAFNNASTGAQFDYGWGTYNMTTHALNGHCFFILKLNDGTYKKIWIKEMSAAGVYTFIYSNLDGTNSQTVILNKSNYTGKQFAYYSLTNNAPLNPAPNKANWTLMFTQYTTNIDMGNGTTVPYGVTGVLVNEGVKIAKLQPVDVNAALDHTTLTYSEHINTIGYNWKTFNMSANTYDIADSTLFVVKDLANDYWKVMMTGFEGSANGKFIFNKEKIQTTTSLNDKASNNVVISVFPNPATNGNINLMVDAFTAKKGNINIVNMIGQVVYQNTLSLQQGLQTKSINISDLKSGTYILSLVIDGQVTTQRFIVK